MESQKKKEDMERLKLVRLENFYSDHIRLLKEKIEKEGFQMQVSKYAQTKMLSDIKKDLKTNRR